MRLNDQPSQTAIQPVRDASVVITALLWGRTPSGTPLRRKSLFLQGSRVFMQNCVTNRFTPSSLLEGDERNKTNTVCHSLSTGPEGSPLMLLLSAKTTSENCVHSPVLLTGNVLNDFPDCWPPRWDMHSLSQNQNGFRGSGDCCSSSLQWNQGIEYGQVLSLCQLLLDLEWGCRSTNRLYMEEFWYPLTEGGLRPFLVILLVNYCEWEYL